MHHLKTVSLTEDCFLKEDKGNQVFMYQQDKSPSPQKNSPVKEAPRTTTPI